MELTSAWLWVTRSEGSVLFTSGHTIYFFPVTVDRKLTLHRPRRWTFMADKGLSFWLPKRVWDASLVYGTARSISLNHTSFTAYHKLCNTRGEEHCLEWHLLPRVKVSVEAPLLYDQPTTTEVPALTSGALLKENKSVTRIWHHISKC